MNFKNRLYSFMYGRYGVDKLSYALWIISIVLSVAIIFIPIVAVKISLQLLSVLLLIYVFFRMFSRNHYKRRKENEKFIKLTKPISSFFKLNINRFKYRKTHCYRKCPHCKNQLRLPKVKGSHKVACPVCGNSFSVKI